MPQSMTPELRTARALRDHRREIGAGVIEATHDRLVALGADDTAEHVEAARRILLMTDVPRAVGMLAAARAESTSDAARRVIREAMTELDGLL